MCSARFIQQVGAACRAGASVERAGRVGAHVANGVAGPTLEHICARFAVARFGPLQLRKLLSQPPPLLAQQVAARLGITLRTQVNKDFNTSVAQKTREREIERK